MHAEWPSPVASAGGHVKIQPASGAAAPWLAAALEHCSAVQFSLWFVAVVSVPAAAGPWPAVEASVPVVAALGLVAVPLAAAAEPWLAVEASVPVAAALGFVAEPLAAAAGTLACC